MFNACQNPGKLKDYGTAFAATIPEMARRLQEPKPKEDDKDAEASTS